VLSPAKINWTLQVLGRRADGFHELQSWFLALNWGDDLQVSVDQERSQSSLQVSGPCCDGVPMDESNLLLQAEAAWRLAGGRAPALKWQLQKNIPAGGGLGGGSSNAASALIMLQELASTALPVQDCRRIAQGLGSDVDFFWQQASAELRGGRGEIVLAQATPSAMWLVLCLTDLHASTADVFRKLNAPELSLNFAADLVSANAADGIQTHQPWPLQPGSNDLEPAAFGSVPGLEALADELRRHGAFSMSGSGSSFFAACSEEAQATQLAELVSPLVKKVVLCQPRRQS
jgi:4-diphosphocytidyl-2-C-methyl-D-erythritol kinase